MLNTNAVSEHYLHGDLLNSIHHGITKLGKTVNNISIEDLAPVDEFHIGGRLATENFLGQLNFSEKDHILDIGCGLGGAARFVAAKYNSRVTGIDLTKEFIDTGNALSMWLNMGNQIKLQQESALSMSFENNSFDGGYMLHVGMNIQDKRRLFKEIFRVLKPGATFGVYDIMKDKEGELAFPVPWASDKNISELALPTQYRDALIDAGFTVSSENNRREFAIDFFKNLHAKIEANGGPPALGLHTLMKDSTPIKLKNMVDGIEAGYISPVEIIAQKFN